MHPSSPPTVAPQPPEPAPKRRSGRRRAVQIVAVVLAFILAAVAGVAFAAYRQVQNFNEDVGRTDPFAGLTNRPGSGVVGAQNFLLIGSDSRDNKLPGRATAEEIARNGGQRADTVILMHVNAAHNRAYLISIPRDAYVPVPAHGSWGGGRTRISSAFHFGGAGLMVQTVEGVTGVKIDHVVLINFAGFKKMTDALGGVDVVVAKTTYDPERRMTFRAGVNHLDGNAALIYVRQRKGLPNGDFDRMKRQQQFIMALLKKATETGTLANPRKLSAFLDATSDAVIVDRDLSVGKTAVQFRHLRAQNLTFITTPNVGSVTVGGASVVRLDRPKALALFTAVKNDTVDEWLKTNPPNNVTTVY